MNHRDAEMQRGSMIMSRDHEPSTDRNADGHVRATISQVRELADVGIRAPMGFMGSLDLQHWTRIGALNRHDVAQPSPAASSGGVSPPGPSSSETLDELAGGTPALQGRFMGSLSTFQSGRKGL